MTYQPANASDIREMVETTLVDPAQITPNVTHVRSTQVRMSPTQRENMMARIARLYLSGSSLAQIATDVGVQHHRVTHYLKILEGRWRARADADYDRAKARELAKLDNLEDTYWDAWERSRARARKDEVVAVPVLDSDGNPYSQRRRNTVKTEERVGDPRYLDGVFKCIDRRIKLLGLDAEERSLLGGRPGEHANALEERLKRYAVVFGAAIVGTPLGPAEDHGHREPLDSDRSAPEASGILDVDGVER